MIEKTQLKVKKHTAALLKRIFQQLEPPPDISLSQWADTFRKLSQGASSMSGQWHTDAAPYQREIMDSITDIKYQKTVVMSAAQTGKTDAYLLNTIGYFTQYDPSPIMVMQPTLTMAESFSKDRLSPMFRDTPVLSSKIKEGKSSGNTILHKVFPGGYVTMVGSNSPQSLASRPIRILLADEIDRYPASAGNEGDPLFLAGKRQETFWNAKEIDVSTPTIKGASRIEVEYLNSSRGEWTVPCPECGKYQPLNFEQVKYNPDNLENIDYVCLECGAVSSEAAWREQFQKGKYLHAEPENPVRGFHLNVLASTLPGASWRKVVEKYIKASEEAKKGNMEMLKAWTNTEMGETWEEQAATLDDGDLAARCEDYGAEVPGGVLILTAGVDTQDDRFEVEVVGWGVGRENWGIKYHRIFGDMDTEEPYNALDEFLDQTFTRADGAKMKIQATFIDSGGHHANEVYKFCKPRINRRIFPIKGQPGADRPYLSAPSRGNRYKVYMFNIGVDTGKSILSNRLQVKEPGANYCHFATADRGYDSFYFKGLTAEKQTLTYKKGKACFVWELKNPSFKRNEPFDVRNYATAAMEMLDPPMLKEPPKKGIGGQRRITGRKPRGRGMRGGVGN